MHTDRSPVRLVMYEDRLELENLGGLYGRITVDDLGKASADMPAPVFIDRRGVFKVIFYKKSESKGADVDMEQEILNYCVIPRSREELAKKFRFEAPTYFIKTYISPLLADGKIKMTMPDKSKSKFQKYYSTI